MIDLTSRHLVNLCSWRTANDKRQLAPLKSTQRRTVSGFSGGKRKVSAQGRAQVVYSQLELDSHADTIVCGSNCLVIHFTGKECDVSPYTDTYEAIKSVPIVQAATAYDNPDTGETTILILNEAIWMGDKMDHTLVNPNQLRAYGLTVQDNPFSDSPIFISTEGNEFVLPLSSTGTILGAATRTPTEQELQTCPHISMSSDYEWDPQNVRFPEASRTVEEEVSRTVGAVRMLGDDHDYDEGKDETKIQLLNLGDVSQRMIASVKVKSLPRKVSQVEAADVQDIPQLKSFQSKGRHSSVTPESLCKKWQIGLEVAKETIKRTTQRLSRSGVMPLARRYRAVRQVFSSPNGGGMSCSIV